MTIDFLKRNRLIKWAIIKLQGLIYGKVAPPSDNHWVLYHQELAKNAQELIKTKYDEYERRWFSPSVKDKTINVLKDYQNSWWWRRLWLRWKDKELTLKLDLYLYRQVQDALANCSLNPGQQHVKILIKTLGDASAAIREPILKQALQRFSQWLALRSKKGYPLRGYIAYRTMLQTASPNTHQACIVAKSNPSPLVPEGQSQERVFPSISNSDTSQLKNQLQLLAQEMNFYTLLGLDSEVAYSKEKIREKYKNQLLLYHVDRVQQADLKELATTVSQRIIAAYAVLTTDSEHQEWQEWYAAHKTIPQAQWPKTTNWYEYYKPPTMEHHNRNSTSYSAEEIRININFIIRDLIEEYTVKMRKSEKKMILPIIKLANQMQGLQSDMDKLSQQYKKERDDRLQQCKDLDSQLQELNDKIDRLYQQDNEEKNISYLQSVGRLLLQGIIAKPPITNEPQPVQEQANSAHTKKL